MDNITHSLVGVALAEVVTRRGATKAERRVAVGAGIVATNLPDIDIAYSVITEAPIGYLLHHRGHTHTVVGLGVLAFALALAYRVAPRTRRPPLSEQFRLWLLIAMALASTCCSTRSTTTASLRSIRSTRPGTSRTQCSSSSRRCG